MAHGDDTDGCINEAIHAESDRAADENTLAVGVGGEVAGREQRDVGHLLGLSEPTRWNRLQKHHPDVL